MRSAVLVVLSLATGALIAGLFHLDIGPTYEAGTVIVFILSYAFFLMGFSCCMVIGVCVQYLWHKNGTRRLPNFSILSLLAGSVLLSFSAHLNYTPRERQEGQNPQIETFGWPFRAVEYAKPGTVLRSNDRPIESMSMVQFFYSYGTMDLLVILSAVFGIIAMIELNFWKPQPKES